MEDKPTNIPAFVAQHPELAKEWDLENNSGVTNASFTPNKKFAWKCSRGHIWFASTRMRIRGSSCPICRHEGFERETLPTLMSMIDSPEQTITPSLDHMDFMVGEPVPHLRTKSRAKKPALVARRKRSRDERRSVEAARSKFARTLEFESQMNWRRAEIRLPDGTYLDNDVYAEPLLTLSASLIVLKICIDNDEGTELTRLMVKHGFDGGYLDPASDEHTIFSDLSKAWTSLSGFDYLDGKIAELLGEIEDVDAETDFLRYSRCALKYLFRSVVFLQSFDQEARPPDGTSTKKTEREAPAYEMERLVRQLLKRLDENKLTALAVIDHLINLVSEQSAALPQFFDAQLPSDLLVAQTPYQVSTEFDAASGDEGLLPKRLDLCFGFGNSLGRAMHYHDVDYETYGVEKNESAFLIGLTRLLILENNPKRLHLYLGDALQETFFSHKFENIIVAPPSGSRVRGPGGRAEVRFLTLALDLLAPGGTANLLLPQSILRDSSKDSRVARERLLREFAFEIVVVPENRIKTRQAVVVSAKKTPPGDSFAIKTIPEHFPLPPQQLYKSKFGRRLPKELSHDNRSPEFEYETLSAPRDFALRDPFHININWFSLRYIIEQIASLKKNNHLVDQCPLGAIARLFPGHSLRNSEGQEVIRESQLKSRQKQPGDPLITPILNPVDIRNANNTPSSWLVSKSEDVLASLLAKKALRTGDLVFFMHSQEFSTHVVDERFKGWLPGKNLSVIRIKDTSFLKPKFLRKLLQSKRYAEYFAAEKKGRTISYLPRQVLSDLPIPIVSASLQDSYGELKTNGDLLALATVLPLSSPEARRFGPDRFGLLLEALTKRENLLRQLDREDLSFIQRFDALIESLKLEREAWERWRDSVLETADKFSGMDGALEAAGELIAKYNRVLDESKEDLKLLLERGSVQLDGTKERWVGEPYENLLKESPRLLEIVAGLGLVNKRKISPPLIGLADDLSLSVHRLILALGSPDAELARICRQTLLNGWSDTSVCDQLIRCLEEDGGDELPSLPEDAVMNFHVQIQDAELSFWEQTAAVWNSYKVDSQQSATVSASEDGLDVTLSSAPRMSVEDEFANFWTKVLSFANNLLALESVEDQHRQFVSHVVEYAIDDMARNSLEPADTGMSATRAALSELKIQILRDLRRVENACNTRKLLENPLRIEGLSLKALPGEHKDFVPWMTNVTDRDWLIDVKWSFPDLVTEGDSLSVEWAIGPGQKLGIADVSFKAPKENGQYIYEVEITANGVDGTSYRQIEYLVIEVSDSKTTSWLDYITNPYILGQPIYGDQSHMFFGRESRIDEIKSNFSASSNIILLQGNRRIGKTSILHQIQDENTIKGWIPVWFNLQSVSVVGAERGGRNSRGFTEKELYTDLALTIKRRLGRVLKRTELGKSIRQHASAFEWLSSFDAKEIRGSEVPFATFREFTETLLEKIAPLKIFVMFDEFDRINESIESKMMPSSVLDNIRQLLQSSSALSGLICGSLNLTRHKRDYWGVLYGIGKNLKLGALDDQSAEQLVTRPVEGVIRYDRQVVKKLLRVSGNQPLELQRLASNIYDQLREEQVREVRAEHYDAAVAYVVENNGDNFHAMLQQIKGPRVLRYLLFLISNLENEPADGERHFIRLQEMLHEKLEVNIEFDELEEWLSYLTDLDFISSDVQSGEYKMRTPLFQRWMLKKIDWELEAEQSRADWLINEQSIHDQ